jgi:hypothetical protein
LTLAIAQDAPTVSLFNGRDLVGWQNVNCAPGTFFVQGNEIITTGKPTGFLRTDRQYENFELEVEWMHENKTTIGNSGIFVWGDPLPAVGTGYTRGIEVQVLVNYKSDWATNHGDLFSIWGAKCTPDRPHPTRPGLERCLPSEERCKPAGEWNHYKIIGNNGTLKLHVNGKEVSGVSGCSPRKGYLALESEGAVCHFRNLKLRELPSSNPPAEQIANLDRGHRSFFDGLTFTGFEAGPTWKAADGVARCSGTSALAHTLATPAAELLFDWKRNAKDPQQLTVLVNGKPQTLTPSAGTAPGTWNRAVLPGPITGRIEWSGEPGLEVRSLFAQPAS